MERPWIQRSPSFHRSLCFSLLGKRVIAVGVPPNNNNLGMSGVLETVSQAFPVVTKRMRWNRQERLKPNPMLEEQLPFRIIRNRGLTLAKVPRGERD